MFRVLGLKYLLKKVMSRAYATLALTYKYL